jgi:hypothetical protein
MDKLLFCCASIDFELHQKTKLMKKLEYLLGLIAIAALIFQVAHVPGSGLLFTVAVTLLAIVYYPLGFARLNGIGFRKMFFKSSYKGISTWRIIGAIVAGMVISLMSVAILFKVQYWPGAEYNLQIGLMSSAIVLVFAVFKFLQNKEQFYKGVIVRLLIFGIVGIALYGLSPIDMERIKYGNHPEYLEAFEQYMQNPDDDELYRKMRIEQERIYLSDEDLEAFIKYIDSEQ